MLTADHLTIAVGNGAGGEPPSTSILRRRQSSVNVNDERRQCGVDVPGVVGQEVRVVYRHVDAAGGFRGDENVGAAP